MKEFLSSLLSRKFLLALGTTLVMIANKQYVEAAAIVLGYCGLQSVGQAFGTNSGVSTYSSYGKTPMSQNVETDKSEIVTGKIV